MYIDTSSLVAFYVPEEKTAVVNSLVMESDSVVVSTLTKVEFISAVNKKFRIGTMTIKEVSTAINEFERQLSHKIIEELDFGNQHYNSAAMLLKQSAFPLRTLDALHLSVCYLGHLPILSFDKILLEAAKEFNIQTVDYSG